MIDIILFIIGILFCITGIVGSFVPIIPGPMSSWVGILVLNFSESVEFNYRFLIITFIIAAFVSALDYIIPIIGLTGIKCALSADPPRDVVLFTNA